MEKKIRARDLGLDFHGQPGSHNAITDVTGVAVGYKTIIEGEGKLKTGKGPIRTGVTTVLPKFGKQRLEPVWAGYHVLNGAGEMTGCHWVEEGGYFLGPIIITNTHSIGMAHHAATKWMLQTFAEEYKQHHQWALPVVAETYDGVLNDINGLHIKEEHVLEAISNAATGSISEGNVGGGTGMISYEFKGGTGTASRQIEIDGKSFTVGALVQANHGLRRDLTILGVPVGRHLTEDTLVDKEQGSIIVLVATDVPMLPHQLKRLARRSSLGVGRGGTPGGNGSGDIFLSFSTANEMPLHHHCKSIYPMDSINDENIDTVFLAAVEAMEEAVINALVAAKDMVALKPHGYPVKAINHGLLVDVMRKHGRCR